MGNVAPSSYESSPTMPTPRGGAVSTSRPRPPLAAPLDPALHRPSRRPVRRIALALTALAVVTAGTAAAAGLFSPKQVATGMPAGAAIFDQTDPTRGVNAGGTR